MGTHWSTTGRYRGVAAEDGQMGPQEQPTAVRERRGANGMVAPLDPAQRQAILKEAIAGATRVGWQLVRQFEIRAELQTPDGQEKLYLAVMPDGHLRQFHVPS